MKKPIITAHDILLLLGKKHSEDVFVPECKNGPTWGNKNNMRLDAWALKKSYSKPCMTGYEVKVSRSNFLNDDKMQFYKNYCNSIYLVCPWGMVKEDELPEGFGLMYVTKNGGRLNTKKKSPYREIEEPVALFKYLLISRCNIIDSAHRKSEREYWENWLREKNYNKDLGYNVSKKIRQIVKEQIDDVRRENDILKRQNHNFEKTKEFLKSIGIEERQFDAYSIANIIKTRLCEDGLRSKIKHAISALENILEENDDT